MNLDFSEADGVDENVLNKLIQFDEALRAGELPPSAAIFSLGERQIAELVLAQQCLQDLESVIPRGFGREEKPAPREAPAQIGRFVIQRALGRGGFATVFLAYDPLLDRRVALKVPHPHAIASPDLRRRFVREGKAVAQLDHPHIISTLEAGEAGDQPYIAYAYCEGPTLAQWIQQCSEPMESRAAARLIAQLADAVQFSHDHGILHRDIKPANVLLFPQAPPENPAFAFVPRLGDFGLAKVIESSVEDTASSMLLGTPLYMAPEQATARHDDIGPSTDVYGLGAILYYLLTGRPPFQAVGLIQTLHHVIAEDPVAPTIINPTIPRDLAVICQKCLEKSISRRYPSPRALADDLRRFLAHQPIHARPLNSVQRISRWTKRQPALASLAAVCVISLLVATIGVAIHDQRVSKLANELVESNQELKRVIRSVEDKERRAINSANEYRALLYASDLNRAHRALKDRDLRTYDSLLRKHAPRAEEEDIRDVGWWHLHQLAHRNSTTLTDFGAAAYCVRVSADGQYIAASCANGTVRVLSTDDHRLIASFSTNQGEVNGVSFSHSGERLATAGDDGTVRLWDRANRTEIRIIKAHEGLAFDAIFTPDDRLLITCGNDPIIRVWNVESGEKVGEFTGHERAVESIDLSGDGTRLISASADMTCRVWNVLTYGEKVKKTFSANANTICYNDLDNRFYCGLGDGKLSAVDPAGDSGAGITNAFTPSTDSICDVEFSPYRRQLIVAARDGSIRVIEPERTENPQDPLSDLVSGDSWHAHEGRIYSLAVSPDGKSFYSSGEDGLLKKWSLDRTTSMKTIDIDKLPKSNRQLHIQGPRSGRVIVVHPDNGEACLWNPFTSKVDAWASLDKDVTCLLITNDEMRVLVGYAGGAVEMWTMADSPVRKWRSDCPEGGRVQAFAAAHRENWIFIANENAAAIRKVDMEDGRDIELFHFDKVWSIQTISVSPDDRMIAAGHGRQVLMWDRDRDSPTILAGHMSGVHHVDFHPIDPIVASASVDRTVRLWDVQRNREVAKLEGHRASVLTAMFTADGRNLISASADGCIKIWHVKTHKELYELVQLPEFQKLIPTLRTGWLYGVFENTRLFAMPLPVAQPTREFIFAN